MHLHHARRRSSRFRRLSWPSRRTARAPAKNWRKRWVYISSNLYVDENVQKVEEILRRARAADYTGVLFSDTKTLTWPLLSEPERWKRNAARVRAEATKLGLELVVCVFPFGYGGPFLAHDPNLAAGLPIRNASLVRRGDRLVPEQPARVGNGSFEEYRGDRAADFGLQDDSGKGSFVDTKIFREGRASLRFENAGSTASTAWAACSRESRSSRGSSTGSASG